MTVQELSDLLSTFPPDDQIVLAIAIKLGGLDVYRRGSIHTVDYLPTDFRNTKRQLCLIGETENGHQSSLGTVSE